MILDGQLPAHVEQAAHALAAGGLVGLPTETVYGLAADACNDQAVRGIYAAKGRPADHPLIVHVCDASQAAYFARNIPGFAQELMQRHWPGPLTLILERQPGIADGPSAGQGTIGLRCPAHPVAQALLRSCLALGIQGLAAPSANRFGKVSPTSARHVEEELGPDLLVLDGGDCTVGIESTIVDCTRGQPVVLRPGDIARSDIERGPGLAPGADAPNAPGTLAAHYAPKARVRLMSRGMLETALDMLGADAPKLGLYSPTVLRVASSKVLQRRMPTDPRQAARELFATLRSFDEAGVSLIWVETPPDTPEWEAVLDRLQRAAASG
ncbi:MAG: hypothetical protein RL758_1309 [Pseudomonadota bacterium]|jgi:L-threonylcarbamoyladenylate synthase